MPSLKVHAVWNDFYCSREYIKEPKLTTIAFTIQLSAFSYFGKNDEEKEFASAVFGNRKSSLELKLLQEGDDDSGILSLICCGDINIFEVLKNQFANEINLSVTFAKSMPWIGTIASSEEMTIDDDFKCAGVIEDMDMKILEFVTRPMSSLHQQRMNMTLCLNVPNLEAPWILRPIMELELLTNPETEAEDVEEVRQLNRKILEEGNCSDLIITAKNGAEIEAHRSFLSASSPVFERMFKNEMKESLKGKLDMVDMTEKGVNAFLSYMYIKNLSVPKEDVQVAFELMRAGHKYQMPTLNATMMTRLVEANAEEVGVQLAFEIYGFVKNIESGSDLKNKMLRIMKMNWDEWEASPKCMDLFENNFRSALELCRDLVKSQI